MSRYSGARKTLRGNGETRESNSSDAVGEPNDVVGEIDNTPTTGVTHEAQAERGTVETLNRYLAVAAQDREAAEERSSQVVARFTKLTIAMMCLTTVIAVANVAMILRQSSAAQSVGAAPSHRGETPTGLVPSAQPVLPAPSVLRESTHSPEKIPLLGAPPVEKIPLLGTPPSTKVSQAPAQPRVARVTPPHPRPQPLLSAGDEEGDDSGPSGPAERW